MKSKLIYGLETVKLDKSSLKKYLSRLESNCLKIACGLNTRSRFTPLLYGMGNTPIEVYIYKRKICFILQLIRKIIASIGIREEMKSEGHETYQGKIELACFEKLREIASSEKIIKSTSLVIAVEFLLKKKGA